MLRSRVVRVTLALVLAAHVRSRYDDLLERRASWGESMRVPVMVRDRPAGSVVRAKDVAWKDLPRAAIAPGTPRVPAEITGRRLVSSIGAGEVVTATRLARGPASALRARTGEGRFAVAVSTRENRPRLSVGDEVDVIDAAGVTAATRTVVVQADGETVTLSVRADDLPSLSRALGGPVLLAARGEERR
jgi:Flp pilus assembly protein CpaB